MDRPNSDEKKWVIEGHLYKNEADSRVNDLNSAYTQGFLDAIYRPREEGDL
jgi:hypothetical protein